MGPSQRPHRLPHLFALLDGVDDVIELFQFVEAVVEVRRRLEAGLVRCAIPARRPSLQ
jgi:hypothetical protein